MMEKKSFIITIDTESDNQWDSSHGQSTKNAKFIPRFQELCEKYEFKPVYLIDYSMGQDPFLIDYLKDCNRRNTCEIGMHLHAWDTPPYHELDRCTNARPYLIEYPLTVMREKVKHIHDLLSHNFECKIVSHRAGRWIINEEYIEILSNLGYKVDCSITPGIDWTHSAGGRGGGIDYSHELDQVHYYRDSLILEVPMTLKRVHKLQMPQRAIDLVKEPVKFIKGRYWWLRPALSNNDMMREVLRGRQQNYAEFMMHSSEMMPGGSPYFRTREDIENLYRNIELLFEIVSEDYAGITLYEYYQNHR